MIYNINFDTAKLRAVEKNDFFSTEKRFGR